MGLYYQCSKNKGTDQLHVTAQLICVFVFSYAKMMQLYVFPDQNKIEEVSNNEWKENVLSLVTSLVIFYIFVLLGLSEEQSNVHLV